MQEIITAIVIVSAAVYIGYKGYRFLFSRKKENICGPDKCESCPFRSKDGICDPADKGKQ